MLRAPEIREYYNIGKKNSMLGSSGNHKPQFGLQDLVGEIIIQHREISSRKQNPYTLDVIDFESGRTLIMGVEGWQDGSTLHSYLVEYNGKVKYSDELFSADIRNIRKGK